jgi:hypothetical protein
MTHQPEKPKKKKKNRAAQALIQLRWAKTTPEERSKLATWLNAQKKPDPEKPRCPCGAMTLKRALTRGLSAKDHKPRCKFYPRTKRPKV